jgi:hypothetical protein
VLGATVGSGSTYITHGHLHFLWLS